MIIKKILKVNNGKKGYSDKSKSKHITDLCNYILDAKSSVNSNATGEKVLCSGFANFIFENKDAQIGEMIALAAETKSLQPVDHFVLSWRSDEKPTIAQIEQAIKIFVKECDMENHQYIYGAHDNTENIHVHIAINRVDPTTLKLENINNGFDKIVCQKALAKIEHAQGLKVTENAMYKVSENGRLEATNIQNKQTISNEARQVENRTERMSAERRAKLLVEDLKQAKNWKEFNSILKQENAFYNLKAGGAVIRFADTDEYVKASKVARELSRSNLEKRFGAFEEPQKHKTNNERQEGKEQMNIETVKPIKVEIVEEQKKETQENKIDELVKKEEEQKKEDTEKKVNVVVKKEEEQKKEDTEVSKLNTTLMKNTFVSFVDKMGDGKDILKNEQVISQLQKRYYTHAKTEQMLFEKIKADAEKCNIKLSDDKLQVVAKTVYNTVHATREVADTNNK